MFMTSNQCIPVKNKLGCSAVVYCVFYLLLLFSAVCCVIRAVHKFYFRLATD
jgi:hypothetical protein